MQVFRMRPTSIQTRFEAAKFRRLIGIPGDVRELGDIPDDVTVIDHLKTDDMPDIVRQWVGHLNIYSHYLACTVEVIDTAKIPKAFTSWWAAHTADPIKAFYATVAAPRVLWDEFLKQWVEDLKAEESPALDSFLFVIEGNAPAKNGSSA